MSSKRLTMENLMRLTRSQTKAKKANKTSTNMTTTEPSVSGYKTLIFVFYFLRKKTTQNFYSS